MTQEQLPGLQRRLEEAQENLEEVEIKIKIRRGLLGWSKFTHHFLLRAFFSYRWMRTYLRVSRGCVHFAKWQLDIAMHWREEALGEVINIGWEIAQVADGDGERLDD